MGRAVTHAAHITAEAKATAEHAAEEIGLRFPKWDVSYDVLTGTPDLELIDAADDWNADLLIVGSQKRNALGRLLLGSVSKAVVTGSHRSVAATPGRPGTKRKSPPSIVIGIDGSEASRAAVSAVGRRVWREGTGAPRGGHDHVTPARIASRLPQAATAIDEHNTDLIFRKNRMIEWARHELKSIGLNVSISIQKGDPKRILLREAERSAAESIFSARTDFKNAFERFRLGSVSTSVVTNAPCSVEVARSFAQRGRDRPSAASA